MTLLLFLSYVTDLQPVRLRIRQHRRNVLALSVLTCLKIVFGQSFFQEGGYPSFNTHLAGQSVFSGVEVLHTFCTLEPIMMLAVLGVNPQHTSAVSLRSLSLSEGYSLLSRAILSLSDRMSLSYFFSISRMWDSYSSLSIFQRGART